MLQGGNDPLPSGMRILWRQGEMRCILRTDIEKILREFDGRKSIEWGYRPSQVNFA